MAQDPGSSLAEHLARPGTRIGCVLSTYHAELTRAMLDSARAELGRAGIVADDLPVIEVPGAFELPIVAGRLARERSISAVLCFGLVLKGETSHDQHVARAAIDGLQRVMERADKPVLLGLLTCDTYEQARARALPAAQGGQDKGREVARAALAVLAALDEVQRLSGRERSLGFSHPPLRDPAQQP